MTPRCRASRSISRALPCLPSIVEKHRFAHVQPHQACAFRIAFFDTGREVGQAFHRPDKVRAALRIVASHERSVVLQVVVRPDRDISDPFCEVNGARGELFVLVPHREHAESMPFEHRPVVDVGAGHGQEAVPTQEIASALHLPAAACEKPVAPERKVAAVFVDARHVETEHVEPLPVHDLRQPSENAGRKVVVCIHVHDISARGALRAVIPGHAYAFVGFGVHLDVRMPAGRPLRCGQRTVGRSVVHHDHFVLFGRQVLIEGRSDTLADQPFEVVQRNYDADFFHDARSRTRNRRL